MLQYIKTKLLSIHQWFVETIWKPSWSRFLSWSAAIPGAALTALSFANDFISNGQVKEYLSMVNVPKTVTVTMVVLGLLGILAKGRE